MLIDSIDLDTAEGRHKAKRIQDKIEKQSVCNICGRPEEITGTDDFGEYTYKPHKHDD